MLYNIALGFAIQQRESGMYTQVPPSSTSLPPPWVVTEPRYEFTGSYSKLSLAVYFPHANVCVSILLSPCVTLPASPLCVHKPVLYGSVSVLAMQEVSSAPFFLDSILMH